MKKWLLIFSVAALFDAALLIWCLTPSGLVEAEFLDVGEGDSEVVSLPGGARILVDGGKGGSLLPELGRALGPLEKRIDVIILTHCQTDHLGGLYETINRYEVGIFVYDGCNSVLDDWKNIKNRLAEKEIPLYRAETGDRIRYGDSEIAVLSPDPASVRLQDENEKAIIFLLKSKGLNFLFMSDAPPDLEREITKRLSGPVDVLKVSQHGSRFSSIPEFLDKAKPLVSIIEVGKNSYGHPASSTVIKLKSYGSVYRTDTSGTIRVVFDGDRLKVLRERN